MRVLFYTYGMVRGTEHLMPWRTLVEVAKWMNVTESYQCAICSAQTPEDPRTYEGITIYSVEPNIDTLARMVDDGKWDKVFYPVTYRQGLGNMEGLTKIPAEVIAYVPGGLTPLSGSLRLILDGNWKYAMPYLLDTLTPHKRLMSSLHKAGITKMVCQAPLTANDAIRSGLDANDVFCALPGKDAPMLTDESLVKSLGLEHQKFLLFSGAPAPTRGALLALKAFDNVAEKLPGVKFVMLMRRDVQSDFRDVEKAIKAIKHQQQVVISFEKVTREQLFGMFKSAWAVLLPFIIVPSEIPLTFFEVMSFGTPVITYENGGTTDYLRAGLKIAKKRDEKSLGEAMISLCLNEDERMNLSVKAKQLMDNHPTWEQTAQIWAKAIEGQNV